MTTELSRFRSEFPGYVGAFIAVTLVLSWTIALVTITDTVPEYTAPLIMFVPAAVTLTIRRMQGNEIRTTISNSIRGVTLSSLLFAVMYPVLFIGVAALIALLVGLGSYQPGV
jgi:hypothetical protein